MIMHIISRTMHVHVHVHIYNTYTWYSGSQCLVDFIRNSQLQLGKPLSQLATIETFPFFTEYSNQ